jgi:tripartite-type tricarboxylate transporter receptor subunit TctC
MRHFVIAAALLLFGLSAAPAQDAYPSKPVTFITPAAAGNSPDVATRFVADRLSAIWKQQIVILNKPGAGGLIAAQAAAGVTPDGYTLYMTQASTFNVLPVQQGDKMPVDLHKAFVPICLIGEQPIGVAVNPGIGVNSVPELIAKIKATQGGLLFGATNRGSQSHLTGELFKKQAKVQLEFVHAQGVSHTISDVAAGRIPIVFEGIAGLGGAAQGGLVKIIGIGSDKRLPNYPDLPTIGETLPGFYSAGWLLLMAPAGTSAAVVNKINADLKTVLAEPDIIERFGKIGTYPHYTTPAEAAAFIKSEEERWWPLVREVGPQR